MKFLQLFSRQRYQDSSRQIANRGEIEGKKADILKGIDGNGVYLLPNGFEIESGALGRTALHQAVRELIAENAIKRTGFSQGFDEWQRS